MATKGGEVECRDMGARCQGGCGEKENRRTRRTRTVCCRNREVPETGTLRGVGGEAFLPYPICTQRHGTSSGEKAIHPTATQQFLKSSSNHAPTTTQPSFVSNPRTISTQPSSIRDSPTPTASSTTTQRWLKFWYNISAFSEEDVGLKNRAGGPSEMMLI